jgi:16S rRNA A1518/A1519 N6-dimethyltransferase RsmA/KsgA/DIM1 with predicted DNA glycosylase/AP lyase activity
MPYSYGYFKLEVEYHIMSNIPRDARIIDVGAGSGTYGLMLKNHYKNLDAIEVWDKYIEEFNLRDIYREVYNEDVLDFRFGNYDYAIFGDVIEHLSFEDADNLLSLLLVKDIKCLVAVPYTMKQGEVNGNIYEEHKQDDLTHDLFLKRYPYMGLLYRNEKYGYYVNYDFI